MFGFLSRRRKIPEPLFAPSVGEGRRVYAIGDIHGRLDLLDQLIRRIQADRKSRGKAETHIIFLGDLVDRGPDSSGVVRRAMELAAGSRRAGAGKIHFLKGNHEEVFIRAARGDEGTTPFLLRYGGQETLMSYGLDPEAFYEMDASELTEWMLKYIPRDHVDFLDDFEDMIEMGDYVFVHAGIKPQVPLAEQKPADLRWIRDEFLNWRQPHGGKIVVHGHTILLEVDEQANRIGIDTGAYYSGRLTAVGLEGEQRWFLSTAD